jgi:hypothetical protein
MKPRKRYTYSYACPGLYENAKEGRSDMTDDRLPDHSRLVYVVIGIVLLIVAIPLILLLILHVLASDVMH